MGIPIGQLRVDTDAEKAVISYSIAKEHRNRGYGVQMARLGEEWIRKNMPQIKKLSCQ